MIHCKLESWLKCTVAITSLVLFSTPVVCMHEVGDDSPASTKENKFSVVSKTGDNDEPKAVSTTDDNEVSRDAGEPGLAKNELPAVSKIKVSPAEISPAEKGKDPSKTPRKWSSGSTPGITEEAPTSTRESEASGGKETGSSQTSPREKSSEFAPETTQETKDAVIESQIPRRMQFIRHALEEKESGDKLIRPHTANLHCGIRPKIETDFKEETTHTKAPPGERERQNPPGGKMKST